MRMSVISPTYNESENVGALIDALGQVLKGVDYEIIISDDDSPDLTWARVQEIGRRNARVRALRRTSNRGLSASVIDGFSCATGEVIACIDADLQHDPRILPSMLEELERGANLVVGSRYMPGGSWSHWSPIRRPVSWTATQMATLLLGIPVKDPMSGYFMLRREDFLQIRSKLNARGFKILLEIAANMKPCVLREIPYKFRPRLAGESKLATGVTIDYLMQLWKLSFPPLDELEK